MPKSSHPTGLQFITSLYSVVPTKFHPQIISRGWSFQGFYDNPRGLELPRPTGQLKQKSTLVASRLARRARSIDHSPSCPNPQPEAPTASRDDEAGRFQPERLLFWGQACGSHFSVYSQHIFMSNYHHHREKSSAQISYKIRLEVGIARTHAGIIWVFDGRFV